MSRVIIFRRLTDKKYGVEFNINNLFFLSYLIVETILFICGVLFYWPYNAFDLHLFWVGALAGIFEQLAMLFLYIAFTKGPAGPIGGLSCVSSVLVAIIEAIRLSRAPSLVEILGLFIGLIGAIELSYPEVFHKLLCCCKANKPKESLKNLNDQKEMLNTKI